MRKGGSMISRPSVVIPVQPQEVSLPLLFARQAETWGARRLWLGQSHNLETFSLLSYLAGAGVRLPLGTCVAWTALRPPYTAGLVARSIAAMSGHPLVAGFGPATPAQVAAVRGRPYDSPVRATADYVRRVRELTEGAPVEVGAGVLRPAMARAVAPHAHVAITWLTPPRYLAERLVPVLRADTVAPRLATVVHFALAGPGRDPRVLADSAIRDHLRLPHYAGMLRLAGLDPEGDAESLIDAGVFVYGTVAEVLDRLAAYRAAGVDEIILNPSADFFEHGPAAALADLEALFAAL